MRKFVLSISILTLVMLVVAFNANAASAAPRLTLSPVSGSYSKDSTFTVTVGVNSDGEKSSAVDAWMTFDKDKLEVVSVVKAANPPFSFDMTPRINNSAGTLEFSCASSNMNAYEDQPINGDLAVITFKAKAVGTAAVNFTCTSGSTTDSNIFNSDINDVISCSSNSVGSYTIASGAVTTTVTPTPTTKVTVTTTTTLTPTATTTATVTTTLPKTGDVSSTVGLIVFGIVSLASALFLKFL